MAFHSQAQHDNKARLEELYFEQRQSILREKREDRRYALKEVCGRLYVCCVGVVGVLCLCVLYLYTQVCDLQREDRHDVLKEV